MEGLEGDVQNVFGSDALDEILVGQRHFFDGDSRTPVQHRYDLGACRAATAHRASKCLDELSTSAHRPGAVAARHRALRFYSSQRPCCRCICKGRCCGVSAAIPGAGVGPALRGRCRFSKNGCIRIPLPRSCLGGWGDPTLKGGVNNISPFRIRTRCVNPILTVHWLTRQRVN